MIKVNLLPQEAVSRRGAAPAAAGAPGGGGALVALALVGAFVVVALLAVYVFYGNMKSKSGVLAAKKELADVEKDIKRLEGDFLILKQKKQVFENQLEVLNSLDPPDRLLWCEKVNLLPELVPEGVFLTRINVEEQVREVETAESIKRRADWEKASKAKRGPKPVAVKKPVIRQTLTIEGVAYVEGGQSDKRLELFTTFLRNLQEKEPTVPFTKKKKSFMQNFENEVSFDPIVGASLEGREVSKFIIRLRSKPM